MTECMMIVEDLLEHNPGKSLIEILYLSTKTPYSKMANSLRRDGYGVLVLTDEEINRRAKEQIRKQKSPTENSTTQMKEEEVEEEVKNACTSAFLEFLTDLENQARADEQAREKEAEKRADEHAKKVEAARRELIEASNNEEKLKTEYEKSVIQKQKSLEAYLDLLAERRHYQ